jgi:hypothetical protein
MPGVRRGAEKATWNPARGEEKVRMRGNPLFGAPRTAIIHNQAPCYIKGSRPHDACWHHAEWTRTPSGKNSYMACGESKAICTHKHRSVSRAPSLTMHVGTAPSGPAPPPAKTLIWLAVSQGRCCGRHVLVVPRRTRDCQSYLIDGLEARPTGIKTWKPVLPRRDGRSRVLRVTSYQGMMDKMRLSQNSPQSEIVAWYQCKDGTDLNVHAVKLAVDSKQLL